MEKKQCSKCLEWFVGIDRHKSKGCKAPCNAKDVQIYVRGEPMSFYERLELRRRFSNKAKRSDPEILPGDALSEGFDMLDESYGD